MGKGKGMGEQEAMDLETGRQSLLTIMKAGQKAQAAKDHWRALRAAERKARAEADHAEADFRSLLAGRRMHDVQRAVDACAAALAAVAGEGTEDAPDGPAPQQKAPKGRRKQNVEDK